MAIKHAIVSNTRTLLMAGTACLFATAAAAQQAGTPEAEPDSVDDVIVTGSRTAPRSRLETPSPVDVLSGDAVSQAALAGELGAALQQLAPSFNFPRQSNSGPADVVRAAQLRGLSPDQTLVLINGRRRHTTAIVNLESKIGRGAAPVDFNAIPVSSVGRIEILRDGAGAQYGSDAIAGVINVLLNDEPTGGRLSVTYGAHVTDFEPSNEDITDGETVTVAGDYGWSIGDGGFLRVGAEYKQREATNRAGPDQIPFFENQTAPNLALQGRRNYRPGDPEVEQVSAWFNTELPLSNGVVGYAFGTLDSREGRGAAFFRYPDSSQTVPAVYPDGYRPETVIESDDRQLVAGLKGRSAGWDLDASLNYGVSDYRFGVERSLNASLGAASPTSFKLGDYTSDILVANLDARREFDVGLASPLGVAAGVEFRRETFETGAGDPASYAVGPVLGRPSGAQAGPGLAPADTADVERDVAGLYVEVSADLTDRLFVDAAARLEDYSDFGQALAGKLAARYAFSDAIAVRGSVSNSFRAPSLSQTGFQFSVTTLGGGGALTTVRTVSPTSPIGQALGARPLEAEESLNLTAGVVFTPAPGLSFSLDAFRIDIDDRITLTERFGNTEAFVQGQTGVAGVTDVNFFANTSDTRTEGVDFVATWRTDLAGGRLNLSGGYSWAETELRAVAATSAQLVTLGGSPTLLGVEERNTLLTAAPKDKASVQADWSRDRVSLLGRVTRFGETTRVFNFGGGFEPEQTYDAKFQLDLEAEFQVTERVSLAVGGLNVLDEYPDRSIPDISFFGNFPYDVLSPIGFNGAYWYGRVSARF